ncbi:Hypothetical protein Minf_0647 [Methylacidiphilum infernorum V4]|uniref:Uncharacterized protein n=1 Tax=Methylacidiphilum infernorum (isolate V4) TaxID=481448 RepID=B3E041_METI4|nr:Hypothetical protein Minf_0647 [Methylacidiphilum infernorum V4]
MPLLLLARMLRLTIFLTISFQNFFCEKKRKK